MTKKICSLGNILMGIILMIGPWFIFGVCSTEEKVMKCFWSCKALFVLGILALLIGILVIITKNKSIINQIIMSMGISIMAILVPSVIIGGCAKSTMHCNTITFPVVYVIAVVNIVLQLITLSKTVKSSKMR